MTASSYFNTVADDIIEKTGLVEAIEQSCVEVEDIPDIIATIRPTIVDIVVNAALHALMDSSIREEAKQHVIARIDADFENEYS